MTSRQRKKDKKSRFVGSWQESPFDKIELPFIVENLKFLLAEGKILDSNYTHQQIANWAMHFWLKFDELRQDDYLLYKAAKLPLDVDNQWDLYLINEFTFSDLKKMDFSKVKLPKEGFKKWLIDLESLHTSSQN